VRTKINAFNDAPGSPYEIIVTVSQDSKVLSSEVPSDGGSGQLSTDDIDCFYYLSIKAE
jgi:hypothetical protein